MTPSFDIAVVGATGTVGETIVQMLEEREFPVGKLHLLASSESDGQSVPFRGKNVRVRDVDAFDFSSVQLAFFAAGPAVTLSFAAKASAAGCMVIDLSGALPSAQAPHVVPEANAQVLDSLKKPLQVEPFCDRSGRGVDALAWIDGHPAGERHRLYGGLDSRP